MAASVVQSKVGAQNTGLATVAATWNTAATAGNLLIIAVGADDYAATPPTGFTQSTGCKQETFLGSYLWWKVAAGGETSVNYTIGSASPSCWITAEISGLTSTPYDTSNGQFQQSASSSYTTPAITPSTGDRYLLAAMGFSNSNAFTSVDTWLNSFTEIQEINTTLGSGTRDQIGLASRSVTGNGSTTFSSGATSTSTGTPQSQTGIIIAFLVAAAGTNAPATEATATGTANSPVAATGGNAPEAAGLGTAFGALVAVTIAATEATATGTADAGLAAAGGNATEATGLGTANNPTTTGAATAAATEATGTGAADSPTASVAVNAGAATATGSAAGPLAGGVLFTTETPSLADQSDGTPGITTATTLRFAVAGQIVAVRFYATATVGGTYTAQVYEVTSGDPPGGGTLLASKALGSAPAAGDWNAIALDTPVTVTPSTVLYRVGVHNDAGRYVTTQNFFSADLVNGAITADADQDNPVGLGTQRQGTFEVNAAPAYPTDFSNASNYFVDVVFAQSATADATAGQAAGTGTADNPTIAATAAPGEAAGTGTAEWDAGSSISLDLVADNPVDGLGIAYDATVSTAATTDAPATEATATGTAATPAAVVGVPALEATGTGTATSPAAAVTADPAEATAAGTAIGPTVSVSGTTNAPAAEAVGAGTADNPAADAGALPTEATAAGAAYNPTVSTVPQTTANAGTADGLGLAIDPVAAVQVLAAAAAAVAAAENATGLIGGNGAAFAGVAVGTGSAHTPRGRRITPRPFTGITYRP